MTESIHTDINKTNLDKTNLDNMNPKISKLPNFGMIALTGDDSIKLLQGQITTNAEKLEPKKLSLTALCNIQGRCIALMFATLKDDSVYLILNRATIPETITTLKKYAVFFKTEITDVSDDYAIFGLVNGSNDAFFDKAIDESRYPFNETLEMSILRTEEANQLNKESLTQEDEWLYHLAEAKVPWLTQVSQSQFLPHDLNLPALSAVDFQKGCFMGQEVIARMHYKGKLKSHLQLLTIDAATEANPLQVILHDDKKVGQVICSATNSQQNRLVLALIKDSALNHANFYLEGEKASILNLIVESND